MTNYFQYIRSRQFWELLPLLFILSVMPFLHDLQLPISKIIFFLLFLCIIEKPRDLNFILLSIFFVGVLLSFISLHFIVFPPNTMGVMNLVYATYGHNHLADYLIFFFPFSVYF